jgi:hypothetical protein
MRILSIDVGIKNLAFCLLEDDKIAKWDVINLAAQEINGSNCGCCAVDKNKKCSNLASHFKFRHPNSRRHSSTNKNSNRF